MNDEFLYKILVVGDIGTGKTSFIKRYVNDTFSITYKATVGVDFALKVINRDDGKTVRIQLWDIAGQERYQNLLHVYYKDAVGAIVLFDITRPSTLEGAKKWKDDIDKKVKFPGTDESIPVVLVANKVDLIEDENLDDNEHNQLDDNFILEIDQLSTEYEFLTWFKASAKNDIGVKDTFESMVKFLLKRAENAYIDTPLNQTQIILDSNENKDKRPCKCET